jgi:ADP-ribose pyrophosphatase YjhB (NUDIX family)
MTVHRRPSKARKKYRPPATGKPMTAVVLLIRNNKVLTVLSRYHTAKNEWEEPGAKIAHGESVRAAAARGLRHETGLDLSQCTYVGECYSPWPKAQVLVYTAPDDLPDGTPGGSATALQWRDPNNLGCKPHFRLARSLAHARGLIQTTCGPESVFHL